MTAPNWQELRNVLTNGAVPAQSTQGLWTLAVEYVQSPTKLRFVVPDKLPDPAQPQQAQLIPNVWNFARDKPCTADGEPRAAINPANCLLASAPPGALIGKIGGSIAGKADGSRTFLIGSYCVCELDDKTPGGPLYLAMNTDPLGALERTGRLVVHLHISN